MRVDTEKKVNTISRDDFFQWESLNKFVLERAVDIKNEYFFRNSDCYVEKVTISEDRKNVHVIGSIFDFGTKIDDFDIEVPINIFLAESWSWKEKVTKFWELEEQINKLKS